LLSWDKNKMGLEKSKDLRKDQSTTILRKILFLRKLQVLGNINLMIILEKENTSLGNSILLKKKKN